MFLDGSILSILSCLFKIKVITLSGLYLHGERVYHVIREQTRGRMRAETRKSRVV